MASAYEVNSGEPLTVFAGEFPGVATQRLLRGGSTVMIAERRTIEVWGTSTTQLFLADAPAQWVVESWMDELLLVPKEPLASVTVVIDAAPPAAAPRVPPPRRAPSPPPPTHLSARPAAAVPQSIGLYRNVCTDELCVLRGGFPGEATGALIGPDCVVEISMGITTRFHGEVFRMLYLANGRGWVLQDLDGEALFALVLSAADERRLVPLQRRWSRQCRRRRARMAAAAPIALPIPAPAPRASRRAAADAADDNPALVGVARYANVSGDDLNILVGPFPGEESGRVVASGGVIVVGWHSVAPPYTIGGPGPVPVVLRLLRSEGWVLDAWGDELLFGRVMTLREERSVVGVQTVVRRHAAARRVRVRLQARRDRAANAIAHGCYHTPKLRRAVRRRAAKRQRRRAAIWLQKAWRRRRHDAALCVQLGWRVARAMRRAEKLQLALKKAMGGMSRALLPAGYAFVEKVEVKWVDALASWMFQVKDGAVEFTVRDARGALLVSDIHRHGAWVRGRTVVKSAGALSFEWSNSVSWWGKTHALLYKVEQRPLVSNAWRKQLATVRTFGEKLPRAQTVLVETRSMLSRMRAQRARLSSEYEMDKHLIAELEVSRAQHESEVKVVLRPQVAALSAALQNMLTAQLHTVFDSRVACAVVQFAGTRAAVAW